MMTYEPETKGPKVFGIFGLCGKRAVAFWKREPREDKPVCSEHLPVIRMMKEPWYPIL